MPLAPYMHGFSNHQMIRRDPSFYYVELGNCLFKTTFCSHNRVTICAHRHFCHTSDCLAATGIVRNAGFVPYLRIVCLSLNSAFNNAETPLCAILLRCHPQPLILQTASGVLGPDPEPALGASTDPKTSFRPGSKTSSVRFIEGSHTLACESCHRLQNP